MGERYGVQIAAHASHQTALDACAVRGLPATATGRLTRWLDASETVRARCVGAYEVGELLLMVHDVETPIPADEPFNS